MASRLQYLFLEGLIKMRAILALFILLGSSEIFAGKLKVNSELFDIGVVAGVMNIEDFPAEYLIGANVTFKASEYFFLQYNYVQADVSKSSFEEADAGATFDLGSDRSFSHYDLLIGYNLFQGEFFVGDGDPHFTSLYLVGGIGDTDFGGEENFTYTIGLGYQIEFRRKYVLRFDYRDYIYETSLIVGGDKTSSNNVQMSVGLGYLF